MADDPFVERLGRLEQQVEELKQQVASLLALAAPRTMFAAAEPVVAGARVEPEEHLRVRADRERGGITEIEHRKVERAQHIRRRGREEIEHCRQLDPLKVVHAPSLLVAAVRAMSERWTEPERPTKEASRDLPTALTRCHRDEENRTCGRGGLSMDNVAFPVDVERLWRRIGRGAGYLVAICLAVATLLYLLDALDALGAGPTYHATSAGPLRDEARWWVAYFAHQHRILWDIIARDTLFPLAFVALIVLALAIRNVGRSARRPEAQLMVVFFVVGGVFSALSDLVYLGASEYWRTTGWSAEPASKMVAVGRSSGALEALTRWPEAAGFVVLAAALVCLARLSGDRGELPSRLPLLANIEALLLIGAALAEATHADTAYDVFSLLTGALVGPTVAAWAGWSLGRTAGAPASVSAPN
jgi:hypothetical protein